MLNITRDKNNKLDDLMILERKEEVRFINLLSDLIEYIYIIKIQAYDRDYIE